MPLLDIVLAIILWVTVAVIILLFLVQVIFRLVRRYFHFPVPAITVFLINNPMRRRVQPPKTVVEWAGIGEGMQVLELGPGGGTFTFEVAKKVGPDGRVYAVDIEPKVTARLEGKVNEMGVKNITVKTASAYELPLPDGSVDIILMVTVLAEVPDRQRALEECRRILKRDGMLAVGELLFDPDYPRRKTVIRWCKEAGFELLNSHEAVLHYLLTFRPLPPE